MVKRDDIAIKRNPQGKIYTLVGFSLILQLKVRLPQKPAVREHMYISCIKTPNS